MPPSPSRPFLRDPMRPICAIVSLGLLTLGLLRLEGGNFSSLDSSSPWPYLALGALLALRALVERPRP